jgi:hypothetical protein
MNTSDHSTKGTDTMSAPGTTTTKTEPKISVTDIDFRVSRRASGEPEGDSNLPQATPKPATGGQTPMKSTSKAVNVDDAVDADAKVHDITAFKALHAAEGSEALSGGLSGDMLAEMFPGMDPDAGISSLNESGALGAWMARVRAVDKDDREQGRDRVGEVGGGFFQPDVIAHVLAREKAKKALGAKALHAAGGVEEPPDALPPKGDENIDSEEPKTKVEKAPGLQTESKVVGYKDADDETILHEAGSYEGRKADFGRLDIAQWADLDQELSEMGGTADVSPAEGAVGHKAAFGDSFGVAEGIAGGTVAGTVLGYVLGGKGKRLKGMALGGLTGAAIGGGAGGAYEYMNSDDTQKSPAGAPTPIPEASTENDNLPELQSSMGSGRTEPTKADEADLQEWVRLRDARVRAENDNLPQLDSSMGSGLSEPPEPDEAGQQAWDLDKAARMRAGFGSTSQGPVPLGYAGRFTDWLLGGPAKARARQEALDQSASLERERRTGYGSQSQGDPKYEALKASLALRMPHVFRPPPGK